MQGKLGKGLICIAATAILWFMPVPDGLKPEAWQLFSVFLGTILAFVLQPLPSSAVILISMMFAVTANLVKLSDVLASWANSTIWLVFAAFLFAKGFIKTGLGRRIALTLTKAFGDSTLKLAYVLAVNDLILAPATPSNTARAGGILFPIVKSVIVSFDSMPGPTARRIGSFLILSVFFVDCVTSAMFMTSMVSNPLIAELAKKTLNIEISWALWIQASIVPGLLSIIIIPLFLYTFYPPELKKIPEAKRLAGEELDKMGPTTGKEKIMAVIFFAILGLWATSMYTKLDATYIGWLGICSMLITQVLDWSDVLEERAAWDVFIWLGGIIGLAGFLAKFGFITWFAKVVSAALTGIPWVIALLLVVMVYFYTHYGFAGMTSHVVLMYAGLAAVAVAAGAPKYLTALSLAFASSLCATITHYGTAPAPIYFGAGYVDQTTWWKFGFLVSVINIVIWVGIGGLWWKFMGLW